MPKLTIGQKAHRVLRFLMGIRTPGVINALAQYGFTEDDLRRGVDRLATVTRTRLRASAPAQDPKLVGKLDEFENRWFQIARVTLEQHYPKIAAPFFSNLVQTSGVECAVTVATFIERLSALQSGTYGPDGSAARALLAQRGLTEERVAEAKALMDTISSFVDTAEATAPAEDRDAAELEMWSWYLEWSVIARAAIRDRRMLRALGFRQTRFGVVDEVVDGVQPAVNAPPQLAATNPPAQPAAAVPPAQTATPTLTNGAASA